MTAKKRKLIDWEVVQSRLFTPKQIKEHRQWARDELAKIELKQLRTAAGVTQVELAKAMKVAQAEISKIESRDNHRVSTLKRVVKALGGELEVVANFNGKRVRLSV